MNVTVNGKPHDLDDDTTVAGLLTQLEFEGGRIAVELNRCIVPAARHASTALSEGDRVEIIEAVGGG